MITALDMAGGKGRDTNWDHTTPGYWPGKKIVESGEMTETLMSEPLTRMSRRIPSFIFV